jgi:broad specificity phosphatase PhoE
VLQLQSRFPAIYSGAASARFPAIYSGAASASPATCYLLRSGLALLSTPVRLRRPRRFGHTEGMSDALLYLVRHAEVVLRGDVEAQHWQLSPEGQRAAELLGDAPQWKRLTLIASSPELKAAATARPIATAAGLEIRTEHALREVNRGAKGFVSTTEYEKLVALHFAAVAESVDGWERGTDATVRIRDCIERLMSAGGSSVCVVSHGLVLSHYLADLRGMPAPTVEEWRAIPQPAVAVVDVKARRLLRPFSSVSEFRRWV